MKVKTVNISDADVRSARTLFSAVGAVYDVANLPVLDAFARNGQLTVSSCQQTGMDNIECWELGAEHEASLRERGIEEVRIGCSYKQLRVTLKEGRRFGGVIIDTPQGLHLDYEGVARSEHFSFLEECLPLLEDTALIVLYVNKKPYNRDAVGSHGYDEYAEYDYDTWMQSRKTFYGSAEITEEQAIASYRQLLNCHGFCINSLISIPCFSDVPGLPPYAFRLSLQVSRTFPETL